MNNLNNMLERLENLYQFSRKKHTVFPTGFDSLDISLGNGGIMLGKIIEIFSDKGIGKSTLLLNIIKNAQKQNLFTLFIDSEHSFDKSYAQQIGIDTNNLLIYQPENEKNIIGTIYESLARKLVQIIAIDSYAGLDIKYSPDFIDELEKALIKCPFKPTIIYTNQMRINPKTHKKITPGGMRLKRSTDIRIKLEHKCLIKKGYDTIGKTIVTTIVKNKLAPPFKTAEINLIYV